MSPNILYNEIKEDEPIDQNPLTGESSGVSSVPSGSPSVPTISPNLIGKYFSVEPNGDTVIGDYSGGQGIFWDQSAGVLNVTGGLVVDSLDIPDAVSANSFHVDVSGNTWWGATTLAGSTASILNTGSATFTTGVIGGFYLGANYLRDAGDSMGISSVVSGGDDVRFWAGDTFVNRATADFFVTESGAITASNITITGGSVAVSTLDGIINLANLNVAAQGWTQTCVFSATDLDTVAWAAGTLVSADGTTYNIGAGNTGNMAARTFIYLDIAVSTIAYQVTTTASTAVGVGKVLVATAINGAVEPTWEVFGGIGGLNIPGTSIVTASITTNEIAANTIVAGNMNVAQLSAIAADLGTITAGSISVVNGGNTIGLTPAGANAIFSGTTGAPQFRVTPAGALTATSATITGVLTAGVGSSLPTTYLSGTVAQANLNVADRGWSQTCVFSVTDADTVAWAAGVLTSADGTAYNIGAGNTGNMAAKTYIYLDTAVSLIAYQITTTATTAVGAGKVLVAIAQNGTGEATYSVLSGQGGQNINGTNIVIDSVTNNEIDIANFMSVPSDEDLVGYWSLDDGSGTTAKDTSQNTNNGTLTNMEAADWVDGVSGKALSFDGTNEFVALSAMTALTTFSIATWVKIAGGDGTTRIIFASERVAVGNGIDLRLYSTNKFMLYSGGAAVGNCLSSPSAYTSADGWLFVVATHDGTNATLYVNGVQVNQEAQTTPIATWFDTPLIGAYSNAAPYYAWNGLIDELRIYDRALSEKEVQALYLYINPNAKNVITAQRIAANTITAAEILAGTITATEINVDSITSLNNLAITAPQVLIDGAVYLSNWRKTGDLTKIDGGDISTGTVTANEIAANTITANELSTSITYAGTIVVDTAGNIRSGQTAYRTGTGWFIGNVTGTPKLSMGVGATGPEMYWDGSVVNATNINILQTFTAGHAIASKDAVYVSNGTTGYKAVASSDAYTSNSNMGTPLLEQLAQSVQFAGNTYVKKVLIYIAEVGSPVDDVQVAIQGDASGPDGSDIVVSDVVDVGGGGALVQVTFTFTALTLLNASTLYWIVVRRTGALSETKYYYFALGSGYASGNYAKLNDGVWNTGYTIDLRFTLQELLPTGYIGKADAATTGRYESFIGFANAAIAWGATGEVAISGIIQTGPTGLTTGTQYYLSDTPGAIATSAGSNTRKVGIAIKITSLLITNIW